MRINSPEKTEQGTPRYRFVVRSAEEAVAVIREQLGESARVVSVRQVEGEGLARFLTSPKLEVTAELPQIEPEPKKATGDELPAPFVGVEGEAEDLPATAARAAGPSLPQVGTPLGYRSHGANIVLPPSRGEALDSTPVTTASMAPRRIVEGESERLWNMLDRAGLGWKLVASLREQPAWRNLSTMPLSAALPRAGLLLRDTLSKTPVRPLTGRVGFFGTAGSGATTALCKQLIREVFFRQKSVYVMKVEGSRSNPSEGLAAFCEALGVPLLRTADELENVGAGVKVYFDLPSLVPRADGNAELQGILEEYSIGSRVLVVNAAYDVDLIKAILMQADALRSRHLVFSHLDELVRWGKLWEFVSDSRRTTLFGSTGQNLAGDCVRDVVELLTQKTLQTLGE